MRLTELALQSGGRQIIPMSTVSRPAISACFSRKIDTDGYAFCGIDAMVDIDGRPRIIEVNGSNAGLTSLGDPQGDRRRAEHQVQAALGRIQGADRGAVLICFAADTLIVGEIMARAMLVHELVLQHRQCQLGSADLDPTDPFVVAVDTVERIASHVTSVAGRLHYRDYPVVSVGNVNLAAELVRRGIIERDGADYAVDCNIFHDGRLAPLIHDKGMQQILAQGTGFSPVRHLISMNSDELVAAVQSILREERAAVIKPNATSGGAGIDFFGPGTHEADIRATLDLQIEKVKAKYGPEAGKSMWPIRVFEFAQSTGYPVGTDHHLWDMRVSCLIRPGEVEMTICGLRICPEPFVPGQYTRATACSNTTGRMPSTSRFRAPLAEADAPTALMRAAGVDDQMFERVLDACAAWCEAAWRHASRNCFSEVSR
ncbi:hypothetical protein J2857_002862 [Neorhizobium galegae]|uniref:hypothetical protein n=1 Tax=Neorhizobium galegae TaxID=399 RepID=UPI001AE7C7E4|nr:hypothetical protein [Neorhizobium galegae]MBP2560093.1 hypothetical protein [Neorhizobium galegae]